ncbi:MAG: copper resistance protein CopC [Actinomycetia bacterium]|nr:copper resistance protein CopC [Actinomycetes bacterium]
MRRLAAGLVLAVAAVVALAAPASAHAQLVSTSPPAGAVLDAAPKVATVRFNEGVSVKADGLQLHDATGRRLDTGKLRHTDGGRTIGLVPGNLPKGGYILTWRVVSADGHPISGGVTWRIGASSAAVDQGLFQQLLNAEGGDAGVRAAAAVERTLLFLALLVLIGGLVFLVAVWPDGAADDRLRPTLRAAAAVGALATVVGMGIQGADVAGLGFSHALSLRSALDTLDTSYGQAAVARLVLLALLAALAAAATPALARTARWRAGVLAGSGATLLTLSLAGHARTGRWVGLALPLDLVHLGAAATWIGGLAVLTFVVLPRDQGGSAAPIAARFSRVAAVAVAAVVGTGVVQGFRQLGSISGVRDTSYGRLLVIKVVLVAVVVVLGGLSRSLLQRQVEVEAPVLVGTDGAPIEPDDDDGWEPPDPAELRRSLRRSVRAEAVIAVVVLAVTSLLVASDPARTLQSEGFSAAKVVQGTVIEAVAAPGRTGPVDMHVYVSDPTFGLTTKLAATATLSLPAKGIPAVPVPLKPAGRGHWSAYDVDIPIKGAWRLDVAITIGDFDQRRAQFTVQIK